MKQMRTYFIGLLLCGFLPWQAAIGQDNPNPSVVVLSSSQTVNCTSEPVQIGVRIHNWAPGFTYEWSHGPTDSVLSVLPNTTTTYILHVANADYGINELKSFEVRYVNRPLEATHTTKNVGKLTCPGAAVSIAADFDGGYAPYTYEWENGATQDLIIVYPEESTYYEVNITDACGQQTTSTISVTLEQHDPLTVGELPSFEYECEGDIISVYPNLNKVSGGVGHGYQYTFSVWDNSMQPAQVEVTEQTTVEVTISDACGIQEVKATIPLEKLPISIPSPSPLQVCKGASVDVTADANHRFYYWNNGQMELTHEMQLDANSRIPLTYIDQCGEPHSLKRTIEVNEPTSKFDYSVDGQSSSIQLEAEDILSSSTYEWMQNEVVIGEGPRVEVFMEEGETEEIALQVTDERGCSSSTSQTVAMRTNYTIPTAFSPNGDGHNDFFTLQLGEELASFQIQIFDRWGQLVYQSSDQYFAWEGEQDNQMLLNTYVYIIKGETKDGEQVDLNGTLSIVN